ncbi:MAG: efflux RND transporter periplasmic adaptor subunit [Actinomycetota bacterium]
MRRNRRWIVGLAATLVVAVGGAWFVLADDDATQAQVEGSVAELGTATVETRDLVERETFDGSLGYDDEQVLSSMRSGTLTGIADEGSTLRRGAVLFKVDERPTVLMLGEVPAYRALSSGVEGKDVRQLQRNLLALGFTDGGDLEVTGEYDADTAEAVRDWQEDLGLDRTGVVELGDVVFTPSASRRMGGHALEPGSSVAAGAQVASTTSTERVVTIDLATTDQDLVSEGDRVQVELPDGSTVSGRIGEIGRVAETDETDLEADPTVTVTVRLTEDVEIALDEAPVDVNVETSRAEDVLAVPVQALLALAEGGYALEVVEGQRTTLVGVQTGDVADGYVEVSGNGLIEGLVVVTAS